MGQNAKISGGRRKYFITGKIIENGALPCILVASCTNHVSLYREEVTVNSLNWLGGVRFGVWEAYVRIRHLQPLIKCEVNVESSGKAVVKFRKPVRAPCPGQIAVVYEKGGKNGEDWIVVCGGEVDEVGKNYMEMGKQITSAPALSGSNDLSVQKFLNGNNSQ